MPQVRVYRILAIILCGFACILIRVWYLGTIQRSQFEERVVPFGRRTMIERVERGPILDRFNIPLAINKVIYNACICYADIAQMPKIQRREKDSKKSGPFTRRVYIKDLSKMLADALGLNEREVEDLIHARAALFPHIPFVIKEGLSDAQYAWLKIVEKDWPGVRAEKGSRRVYPRGRVGGHVVGYMGAIGTQEYQTIIREQKDLRKYIEERDAGGTPILVKGYQDPREVREKLAELEEKAYTLRDDVGKMGMELVYDRELRGYYGKQQLKVGFRGNVLRPLPGTRHPVSGEKIVLSLSAELQEYAEQLLAEHEALRSEKSRDGTHSLATPWIRGGALIAMDPKTGEILALASYPRFDPNDFIEKTPALSRWLEDDHFIRTLWEGIRPLERERFDKKQGTFYEETLFLTFDHYLESFLSKECRIIEALEQIGTLRNACQVQHVAKKLHALVGLEHIGSAMDGLFPEARLHSALTERERRESLFRIRDEIPFLQEVLERYLEGIPYNQDKLLAIDLCRLFVDAERFSPELLDRVGSLTLSQYFSLTQQVNAILYSLKKEIHSTFREKEFAAWREGHFKNFLKEKRAEERAKKTYARPYTDYLKQQEAVLFEDFWERHQWSLLHEIITRKLLQEQPLLPKGDEWGLLRSLLSSLSLEEGMAFLKTMRGFAELKLPLYGTYRWGKSLQDLARAFYPKYGYSYCQSSAYQQSVPQGSVFKIAIAYQALLERYKKLRGFIASSYDLNPLTFTDACSPSRKTNLKQVLGTMLDGTPIYRLYKGGLLPRSPRVMGKLDLASAIERSSNTYFSLLARDYLAGPKQLLLQTKALGFGEKTGIDLPGENPGLLPDDLHVNPTGLYAFAIGQHSLLVTPLQTAVMFSAFANGGHVLRPTTLLHIAGKEPVRWDGLHFHRPPTLFKEPLHLLGIPFALFATAEVPITSHHTLYGGTEIVRNLEMPKEVRSYLLKSMHKVTGGENGNARPKAIYSLSQDPEWRHTYLDLHKKIPGKTGTAEFMYKHTIDAASDAKIQNHIWFGGMSFTSEDEEVPDIIVIAHLRFSKRGGKEAAPLVMALIQKWREIRASHDMGLSRS